MEQNKKFLSIYPLPALLTPLPLIPLTTEEITGCANEAANGANKAGLNPTSCLFISCFAVSVIPSINKFEYSNGFMILIIPFMSSFEINKLNPFPALTVTFPLNFLSILFLAFEAKLLTNPSNISLAKGIAAFISAFFA